MILRQALAAALRAEGVEVIFGLIGDGNMFFLVDAAEVGIRFINARTETAGVLMADGYTRAGGDIGVVTVTHGPGLAAAAVGLGVVAAAGSPVLLIAGDTPRADPLHVQWFEQEIFAQAAGAIVHSIRTAEGALSIVQRAIQDVRAGRGPVVLTVAVDVQDEEVADIYRPTSSIAAAPARLVADDAALDRLASLLADARKPVLLAGRGARPADAYLEILAERTNALLGTTGPARGMFDGNPRAIGVVGGLAAPGGKAALAQADLIVAFGASLNRFTLDRGRIAPQARWALVTNRALAGSAEVPIEFIVLGDAADSAQRLIEKATAATGQWSLPDVAAATSDPLAAIGFGASGAVDPRAVTREVNALFPPDRIEVVGVGHFGGWPGMHARLNRDGRFIGPWEFGSIGTGLPVGMGAAVAQPDKHIVVWEGDGSLLNILGELETLARMGGRLTLLVMDDGAYTAEVRKFDKAGVSAALAQFPRRDLAAAARALGVTALTATDEASLRMSLAQAARATEPVLIHILVDPTIIQSVF